MPNKIVDADLKLDPIRLHVALSAENGPVGVQLERIVAKGERYAKQRCPVDTGRLRSSITHRVEVETDGMVGIVGTNVEYAAPVELGHATRGGGFVPPVGFLRGGVNQAIQEET